MDTQKPYNLSVSIKCMYDCYNPSKKLQDLLDPSALYPRYMCSSRSQDPKLPAPMTCQIFEHVIRAASDGADGEIVVCKVATSSLGKASLVQEADFYKDQKVSPLLGHEIPRFHGLYQTPTHLQASNAEALCLVLEYGGKPLPVYGDGLRDQSIQFQ